MVVKIKPVKGLSSPTKKEIHKLTTTCFADPAPIKIFDWAVWIKKDHKIIASLLLKKINRSFIVDRACVEKKYRRKGYASKLIKAIQKKFSRLLVLTKNKKAVQFYKKNGFKERGSFSSSLGKILLMEWCKKR
jgi:GNAT superfamily N-acetyltransferase